MPEQKRLHNETQGRKWHCNGSSCLCLRLEKWAWEQQELRQEIIVIMYSSSCLSPWKTYLSLLKLGISMLYRFWFHVGYFIGVPDHIYMGMQQWTLAPSAATSGLGMGENGVYTHTHSCSTCCCSPLPLHLLLLSATPMQIRDRKVLSEPSHSPFPCLSLALPSCIVVLQHILARKEKKPLKGVKGGKQCLAVSCPVPLWKWQWVGSKNRVSTLGVGSCVHMWGGGSCVKPAQVFRLLLHCIKDDLQISFCIAL